MVVVCIRGGGCFGALTQVLSLDSHLLRRRHLSFEHRARVREHAMANNFENLRICACMRAKWLHIHQLTCKSRNAQKYCSTSLSVPDDVNSGIARTNLIGIYRNSVIC